MNIPTAPEATAQPLAPGAPATDAATDMTPLPQPVGPTATQTVLEDLPDFRMYKETAVVEL